MPLTLKITLQPEPRARMNAHPLGLRAVVYDWIRRADPEAAQAIHDANQPKPYNIGPLLPWPGADPRTPGAVAFEVSVLVDWVGDLIVAGAADAATGMRLGRDHFRIAGPPELVRRASWEELMQSERAAARWRFRLVSPTAHHAAGEHRKAVVLPSPENYFGTWTSRWNLCAPQPFGPELRELIAERVAVTACDGHTERIELAPNRSFVGFVGEVTFGFLQPRTAPPGSLEALTALARLAEFSGTGVETMSGMGKTELLAAD